MNEKYFGQKLYRKTRHILCSIICFPENRPGYEIMWKIEHGSARKATDDNAIRHKCIACWIPKATDTM
jgi:hypothetical protein